MASNRNLRWEEIDKSKTDLSVLMRHLDDFKNGLSALLVDEFQGTNILQAGVMAYVGSSRGHQIKVFVCGPLSTP